MNIYLGGIGIGYEYGAVVYGGGVYGQGVYGYGVGYVGMYNSISLFL